MAAHHHGRAVFSRDRNDPRARHRDLHTVAQSGHFQVIGRNRIIPRIAAGNRFVFGAIDFIVRLARAVGARRFRILPVIGDDPGACRAAPGQNRRMAGAGFGRGMALMTARKDDALRQPFESAGYARPIFIEQVSRKLVHRNRNDQFWFLRDIGKRARR